MNIRNTLKIKDVAAFIGIHRNTVRAAIRSGRLPVIEVKRMYYVLEEDALAFRKYRRNVSPIGTGGDYGDE